MPSGPSARISHPTYRPPGESLQTFGSSAAEATPHSPLTAMQWQSEMNYAPESRNFVGWGRVWTRGLRSAKINPEAVIHSWGRFE
jgi:hypothetical protein